MEEINMLFPGEGEALPPAVRETAPQDWSMLPPAGEIHQGLRMGLRRGTILAVEAAGAGEHAYPASIDRVSVNGHDGLSLGAMRAAARQLRHGP